MIDFLLLLFILLFFALSLCMIIGIEKIKGLAMSVLYWIAGGIALLLLIYLFVALLKPEKF